MPKGEKIRCEVCGRVFDRQSARGRKPVHCPPDVSPCKDLAARVNEVQKLIDDVGPRMTASAASRWRSIIMRWGYAVKLGATRHKDGSAFRDDDSRVSRPVRAYMENFPEDSG